MHVGVVAPCSSGLLADLLLESEGVDLGCGGYVVAILVRALLERGHRVSVITLSAEIERPAILTGPWLTFYAYPMRTSKRMRDLYKLERQGLKEGIRLAKPDVLHAHWTYEFAMACLEIGFPTLITTHDNAFQQLRYSKDMYRFGRLLIQLKIIRKARFLTAVSPYLADSLRWLSKSGIEVVPNPTLVPQHPNIYERLSGTVRIGTVLNGWSNRKNPKVAIKAFHLLRDKFPDAELYMYGYDFEEGGPAARWASSHELNNSIHFCGLLPYEDLQTTLNEMSILLHPALEESFGMTIIEAMALGVPVVAGINAGAVPWVLDQGRAGFLTDVKDPDKIAQALLTCIEQSEDRKRKQRIAYDRVAMFFSPNAVAEQYEKIYEKMAPAR